MPNIRVNRAGAVSTVSTLLLIDRGWRPSARLPPAMLFNGREDPRGLGFPPYATPFWWGGQRFLIGGVASQPKRPQPRNLFAHRSQFGLVLSHCLLGLPQLLLLLEQRFGATVRLVRIHAQYWNSLVRPMRGSLVDQAQRAAGRFSFAGKIPLRVV
jgi:hypothetical protein